jgi:hypothetical protein
VETENKELRDRAYEEIRDARQSTERAKSSVNRIIKNVPREEDKCLNYAHVHGAIALTGSMLDKLMDMFNSLLLEEDEL